VALSSYREAVLFNKRLLPTQPRALRARVRAAEPQGVGPARERCLHALSIDYVLPDLST